MPVQLKRGARRNTLFVHNNFPGQFGFLVDLLKRDGIRCASISSDEGADIDGVTSLHWRPTRDTTPGLFAPAVRAEADMIRAHAAANCAIRLREHGFEPRLIVGHPGWGETVFLREIFPHARQIIYGEYYYHASGGDAGFDPEFGAPDQEERFRIFAKNATMSLAFSAADRIVSPTRYQAGLLPPAFRARTTIIHEGIDTAVVRRRPRSRFHLESGAVLDASVPVISFVNRCLEPLRGYHILMRALPRLMDAVPNAHVVIVGAAERRGYGREAPAGTTWKDIYLDEVRSSIDMRRVHFVGPVTHSRLRALMSISAAHVYYTYPFVLSWSLLEAMACECLVIASDTAPVRDVVQTGLNGILLDFFDHAALSDALIEACVSPDRFLQLRAKARRTIQEHYSRRLHTIPAWLDLVEEMTAGSGSADG